MRPSTEVENSPENLTPYWDLEHMPCCMDCRILLRAIPISPTEVYYFCRGCHMHYTLDAQEFGNRPLPPEFQHCSQLPKEIHHAVR